MKWPFPSLRQHAFILLAITLTSVIGWKVISYSRTNHSTPANHHATLPKPTFHQPPSRDPAELQKNLRNEVLAALGHIKEQDLHARAAIAKNLPADLTPIELETLLQHLLQHRPANVSDGTHAYFFHELCNKLHHFPAIRATYAETLHQVALDSKHDAVTRDYALQHLRRVWEKSSDLAELRNSIQSSFWQLVKQEPSLAASAMLSLHTLGVTNSPHADYATAPVPTADFQPFLTSILQQPSTPENISQRMTAVRIAGDRKLSAFSDQLTERIQDESEHMLVRTSAINALRKLGHKEQLSTLSTRYAHDTRLTQAFQHATR